MKCLLFAFYYYSLSDIYIFDTNHQICQLIHFKMYDMLIPNTFVYNVLAMMLIPAWTTKNKRLVSTFNKTINKKKLHCLILFLQWLQPILRYTLVCMNQQVLKLCRKLLHVCANLFRIEWNILYYNWHKTGFLNWFFIRYISYLFHGRYLSFVRNNVFNIGDRSISINLERDNDQQVTKEINVQASLIINSYVHVY